MTKPIEAMPPCPVPMPAATAERLQKLEEITKRLADIIMQESHQIIFS